MAHFNPPRYAHFDPLWVAHFNPPQVVYYIRFLHLEPNVSLTSISKLIHKSTQKTSEVINQNAKQNFNDFINYYRIQEAKKILVADASKNLTISAIAFDSGFSSLSSFNSAFKKFEGNTPSVYRKSTK